MKAAVCLILCLLLLEQVHLLSASDDDDDVFRYFFPESKGNKTKKVTIHKDPWTKELVIAVMPGCSPVMTPDHEKGHEASAKHPSEAPEKENPIERKGKGKRWKKSKGCRPRKGGGPPTAAPKSPAPTKPLPISDYGPRKARLFVDQNGDAVY